MKAQLEAIRSAALEAINGTQTGTELDAVRVQYLGKKGELTAVLKQMGKLSPEERPIMGQMANDVRAALESASEADSGHSYQTLTLIFVQLFILVPNRCKIIVEMYNQIRYNEMVNCVFVI